MPCRPIRNPIHENRASLQVQVHSHNKQPSNGWTRACSMHEATSDSDKYGQRSAI